ncbi:alpha/beta hydrolase [Oscillospiraceae bacterium HV4-5-C5C]|nr:alpha/beta hydrolase [Oscillospiraceae bacterium HV4-5-C5C]
MPKALKVILYVLLGLVVLLAGFLAYALLSPEPLVFYLRHTPAMNGVPEATEAQAEALAATTVESDLAYPSQYQNATFDLIYPQDTEQALPVVIWMHGGAFVAGSKESITAWGAQLAQQGYAVIAFNYELAPEAHYPAQIQQIGELVTYLQQHAADYPMLDLQRIILGGDSAGAQMMAQYIALQTNPELAQAMNISATVSPEQLKAALLYCGPYNLSLFENSDSWIMRYFINHLGMAYFGTRSWTKLPAYEQVSVVNYVTSAYPPTYITDGNSYSFPEHGEQLYEKLQAAGVTSKALIYPASYGTVTHEYQFDFKNYPEEAQTCFDQTVAFLQQLPG